MATNTTLYLNMLVPWDGNVRKEASSEGIRALAENIAAHGVLQSLVVRETDNSLYEVIAGKRRHMALNQLASEARIPVDYEVPVRILNKNEDAHEISLAENAVREQMHPADEFEAFRDLIDAAASIEDVAARFGITPAVVKQRLKLARVSPKILAEYRAGNMDLDIVMAFTIADDHAQQEKVWDSLSDWHRNNPRHIKSCLTEGEIESSDKRVRFVGLDHYEQAGGALRRDLFSDKDSAYILDKALLESLVAKKLESAAEDLRADGWSWVEVRDSFGWEDRSKFRQLEGEEAPLDKDTQASLEAMKKEYDDLEEKDMDDFTDDDGERMRELEDKIDEVQNRPEIFSDEIKAQSGCIITLGYDAKADIEYALTDKKGAKSKTAKKEEKDPNAISAALVSDLSAERTAGMMIELIENRDLALRVAAEVMISEVFYGSYYFYSRAKIKVETNSAADKSKAGKTIEDKQKALKKKLPKNRGGVWKWCMESDIEDVLTMIAFCTARSVDVRLSQYDKKVLSADRPENQLAKVIGLDMAKWYTPTAKNFFSRISKPQILQAIKEATGKPVPPETEKLKKSGLAQAAERMVADTGWLPLLLRTDMKQKPKPKRKPAAKKKKAA